LNDYAQNYQQQWQQMMAAKLGIELSGERATEAELGLLVELEGILLSVATDMTIFIVV
tara:strand:- start:398 stop:571 length:174 start_codon:yes stop_codon:yes gene_type:complete